MKVTGGGRRKADADFAIDLLAEVSEGSRVVQAGGEGEVRFEHELNEQKHTWFDSYFYIK